MWVWSREKKLISLQKHHEILNKFINPAQVVFKLRNVYWRYEFIKNIIMVNFNSQGTMSLEISYPGYDVSGEIVPIQYGYDFSWVRFLLGTISPAIKQWRSQAPNTVSISTFIKCVGNLDGVNLHWVGGKNLFFQLIWASYVLFYISLCEIMPPSAKILHVRSVLWFHISHTQTSSGGNKAKILTLDGEFKRWKALFHPKWYRSRHI